MNYKIVSTLLGLTVIAGCSMFSPAPTPAPATTARYAPVTSSQAAARDSSLSQDEIKNVQTKLTNEGFYTGSIDGVWGPMTQAGVTEYQKKHNLTVSGKLDSETIDAMKQKDSDAPAQKDSPASSSSSSTTTTVTPPAADASATSTDTTTKTTVTPTP